MKLPKILDRAVETILAALDPRFWMRQGFGRVDHDWSNWLEEALNNPNTTYEARGGLSPYEYTVYVNGVEVWIGNAFFSYGQPYERGSRIDDNDFPKRRVALKLHKKVQELRKALKQAKYQSWKDKAEKTEKK